MDHPVATLNRDLIGKRPGHSTRTCCQHRCSGIGSEKRGGRDIQPTLPCQKTSKNTVRFRSHINVESGGSVFVSCELVRALPSPDEKVHAKPTDNDLRRTWLVQCGMDCNDPTSMDGIGDCLHRIRRALFSSAKAHSSTSNLALGSTRRQSFTALSARLFRLRDTATKGL